MMLRTLLLTPWMTPSRVISYERAIVLALLGKVEVVVEYDVVIASPSLSLKAPAVVRQRRARAALRVRVGFSRANVLVRDGFTCQSCASTLPPRELNLDHVVPRSRGGPTHWENVVTSCYPCNQRKAGRTPEEAGMRLLARPSKPTALSDRPSLRVRLAFVPNEWRAFC